MHLLCVRARTHAFLPFSLPSNASPNAWQNVTQPALRQEKRRLHVDMEESHHIEVAAI